MSTSLSAPHMRISTPTNSRVIVDGVVFKVTVHFKDKSGNRISKPLGDLDPGKANLSPDTIKALITNSAIPTLSKTGKTLHNVKVLRFSNEGLNITSTDASTTPTTHKFEQIDSEHPETAAKTNELWTKLKTDLKDAYPEVVATAMIHVPGSPKPQKPNPAQTPSPAAPTTAPAPAAEPQVDIASITLSAKFKTAFDNYVTGLKTKNSFDISNFKTFWKALEKETRGKTQIEAQKFLLMKQIHDQLLATLQKEKVPALTCQAISNHFKARLALAIATEYKNQYNTVSADKPAVEAQFKAVMKTTFTEAFTFSGTYQDFHDFDTQLFTGTATGLQLDLTPTLDNFTALLTEQVVKKAT